MRDHGQLRATTGDIRQFSTGTVDQSPLALREDQPSEFASRDQLDLWSLRLDVFVSKESKKDIV